MSYGSGNIFVRIGATVRQNIHAAPNQSFCNLDSIILNQHFTKITERMVVNTTWLINLNDQNVKVRGRCSESLKLVLLRASELEEEKRYQNAEEFAAAHSRI